MHQQNQIVISRIRIILTSLLERECPPTCEFCNVKNRGPHPAMQEVFVLRKAILHGGTV